MTAYYNEHDRFAAAWLRELIKAGHLPAGEVDERDIQDVKGADLEGFTECHFFAGIGGWPYALRLAGWPRGVPVWSGSCPCQPFSCAGKGGGESDARHLWPEFLRLIAERRPPVVFGEQVASAIRHGWIDGVCTDLEAQGYACGFVVLGAHSAGAPHIRERLFWVADARIAKQHGRGDEDESKAVVSLHASDGGASRRLGDAEGGGWGVERDAAQPGGGRHPERTGRSGPWRAVVHSAECDEDGSCPRCGIDFADCGCPGPTEDGVRYRERWGRLFGCRVGDTILPRLEGHPGDGARSVRHIGEVPEPDRPACQASDAPFWDSSILHPCRDGKARRIPAEPALFPLADGIPNRVGALRGAGNAIVPPLAAEFVKAYMEVSA